MKNTSVPRRVVRRLATALVASAVIGASLVACSSGGGGDTSSAGSSDLDAALAKGGSITYWTWTPSAEAQVAAFEKQYPKVKVNLVNVGTSTTQYTKLQNAIKAGSGAPDVAQIEYYALPQFALGKQLVDLTSYGFDTLKGDYTTGPWSSVALDGGIYGLPQDSGPMALFYNKTVFDQYGLTVPKTWDEFVAAAKKLHDADPTKYLAADSGDAGFTSSMIWQAGGHPYSVDGTKVSIDLQDAGAKKWTATWNQLVEQKLLSTTQGWTDEWFKALGNGTIATMVTGAWMPGNLESSVPEASGQWRVAPMPSYDGKPVSAENGGSSQAVIKQSKNPVLAAAFLKWLNNSQASIDVFTKSGGFPATTKDLESSSFLSAAPEYFGGQKINEVLVDAAKSVPSGWQYLPYQVYANSIFADTVGQSYASNSDLNVGLTAWQKSLVEYGNQQGFTVTSK